MRNSPYVPCGFTQAQVARAARDLPHPDRDNQYGNVYRVAVYEQPSVRAYSDPCDNCCNRVPEGHLRSSHCQGCTHGRNSTSYCRYLEFEVNSALDYRTDRIVFWWTLVGGV